MNVAAVVPSYRAAATLPALLERLCREFPPKAIYVVDDGSGDGTIDAVGAFDVNVLVHEVNAGKGTALVTGSVAAHRDGFTHVLCLDADGQHPPEQARDFLRAAEFESVGVVIGARTLAVPQMPWPRVCSNRLTTFLLGLQARARLFDSQCGYRLYRLDALLHPQIPRQGRFEWESETLVRIARQGWLVSKVDIPTIYTDAGSHIRPWRDTFRFVRMWFRLWGQILRGKMVRAK